MMTARLTSGQGRLHGVSRQGRPSCICLATKPDEVGMSRKLANKVPSPMNMSEQLYSYLMEHTREPQILKELKAETASIHGSQMQITPDQGQFFGLLVELLGVQKAIEVGVFTGYSSLAVAMALPPDGQLVALDKDEKTLNIARKYWKQAGVDHKIKEMLGPAQDSLNQLLDEGHANTYDFAFIDDMMTARLTSGQGRLHGVSRQGRPSCICLATKPDEVGMSRKLANKVPSPMNMSEQLYSYLMEHTREPQILKELKAETASIHGSQMQITPDQGQFFGLLVELLGVQKAIEVGVFTGYSSLAVAMALPPDGQLVALDKDEKTLNIARKYWKQAGVDHKIKEMLGPAQDSLNQLLDEGHANTYDFAFIDADKRAYWTYYELLLQLVRPGGLIIADNVLFYGKVADLQVNDKATVALREFNDRLLKDDRITLSTLPVGDGVALCRKR